MPTLIALPQERLRPLPLVLWFHSFGVDKELHRPEMERVAEADFLAVGVGAAGHGERQLRTCAATPMADVLPVARDAYRKALRDFRTPLPLQGQYPPREESHTGVRWTLWSRCHG